MMTSFTNENYSILGSGGIDKTFMTWDKIKVR